MASLKRYQSVSHPPSCLNAPVFPESLLVVYWLGSDGRNKNLTTSPQTLRFVFVLLAAWQEPISVSMLQQHELLWKTKIKRQKQVLLNLIGGFDTIHSLAWAQKFHAAIIGCWLVS